MTHSPSIAVRAPAKVNLVLRVLGARSDGFHEIETLFQAVSIHDDLAVRLVEGGEVTLDVVGADTGPVPANLAYRAARAVLDAAGTGAGVHMRLVKRIPAGAGLGGGSSDAAAALRCVNALLGEPLAAEQLADIAVTLGSDVPFFLGSSTLARGLGRGERLEGLPPLPEAYLALVLPPVHVSTGWAYAALSRHRGEGGEPPCFGVLADGPVDWTEVAALAMNDFEAVVPATHRQVARSLEALREVGAAPAMLSGSGSACFGVFVDAAAATRAVEALSARLPWPVLPARTLAGWPLSVDGTQAGEVDRP